MAKKTLKQVIKENVELGFDPAVIEIAYANVDGDASKIIDEIFKLQSESASFPVKPANPQDEDAQLSKAIEESISQAKDKKISLEPLNPQQRVRKSGVPVGLKNIGNTCYFNSLLQTYFQNHSFVKAIIDYQMPQKFKSVSDVELQKLIQQDFEFKKKLASCKLVSNLKDLFCSMIASDRKYIDPTPVLTSIVDDYGNQLSIGDQKDIGQFNLTFLSRIQDGLSEARKQRHMDIEGQKKEDVFIDSPSKMSVIGQEKEPLFMRRSSIKINESSIIAQQFLGKIQNNFSNQKENIHKTQDQLFSLLFVNVKNKQLYKACEQILISHIDDYRNQKGEVIGVQKQSWIKQAPRTLFFQIDRVVYDKEKQNLKKINDIFDFPKTFYVDPFLLKNKTQALKVQEKVRSLRKQKQQYSEALIQIQNYGSNNLNLLDILSEATNFLTFQQTSMETQKQTDSPVFFSNLKNEIQPSHLQLLTKYRDGIKERVQRYKNRIQSIDKEIQKEYDQIKSTPYYLYSILVHEGSADSGHYYSYTYDHQTNIWKKYNDINISDESEEQVLKEAKGSNYTSAYYLVYAQKDVLVPHGLTYPVKNYKLSPQEEYPKDYYKSFLSVKDWEKVKTDNHQMYYDIEQYKMNAFATRVADVYTKKFETCNQIFRKTKPEKKKNTPPVLVNLPTFVKNIDQDEYKNILIENCINEYGPKEDSPVFFDLLKKKISNFNQFKKPKKFNGEHKFQLTFINDLYRALSSKKLFEAIRDQSYNSIFGLLKELFKAQSNDYFNWLSNLLTKIFVVRLLMQAEKDSQTDPKKCLQKLQILAVLLLKYTNLQEQKSLSANCIYWIAQIEISLTGDQKSRAQKIIHIIQQRKYEGEFDEIQKNKQSESAFEEITKNVDINDALWNLSRQENTVISSMLQARQSVKNKMEAANNLYRQMKKYNYPLKKEEREKIYKSA